MHTSSSRTFRRISVVAAAATAVVTGVVGFPAAGSAVTTQPTWYVAGAGGVGTQASGGSPAVVAGLALSAPQGVALDAAGDLFIADTNNSRIVEVRASGTAVVVNVSSPGGLALSGPRGVALDAAGDLFIADVNNNRIVEVPASGGVAASGTAVVVNVGSPGGLALSSPSGVALDAAGDLFIADTGRKRIVEVPASGGVAASGTAAVVSSGNDTPWGAPQGIAVVPMGQVISGFTPAVSAVTGGSASLSAVASSGLPVSFSVDPATTNSACSVSGTNGSQVSYAHVGSCVLDANQAGNAVYAAASQVQATVTVGKGAGPAPSISNLPASPVVRGSFVASVSAAAGEGAGSVTSSTPGVCAVGSDGLTVSFNHSGTCGLVAHTAAGADYAAADGGEQDVTVGKGSGPAPSIGNVPASPVVGGSFVASVSAAAGEGAGSVTSSTTGVCTVGSDGVTVSFNHVGTCGLVAHTATGADYAAADGAQQDVTVGKGSGAAPSVSNLPDSPVVGDSFTASVAKSAGEGVGSVTSSSTGVCAVGSDGVTVSFAHAGSCVLVAHTAAGADYLAADGADQPVTVGKAGQLISGFAPASAASVGDSATLSADGGGSGNPVTFSVDDATTNGACTVSGDEVSFVHAGSCVLDANQEGNEDYTAATPLQATVTVGPIDPATPSISNLPAAGTVGDSFTAALDTASDGAPSVTSNTTDVCTVGDDGLTVHFAHVGVCGLVAHVAAGADYNAADGTEQQLSVGQGVASAPSISNLPVSGTVGQGFAASITTTGDGALSVTTSTPGVCAVGDDGVSVSFDHAGTCTLLAHVANGTDYSGADGATQDVVVGKATAAATPSISNLPTSAVVTNSFTASVATSAGQGAASVGTDTPDVCTVGSDGLSVSLDHAGVCELTAHVAAGTDYTAADGSAQYVSVGKAGQTISGFTPTASAAVASTATLTATASSALPVVFTVDASTSGYGGSAQACAVSGGNGQDVAYDHVGSCVLNANQAGGDDYTGAPQVQATVNIHYVVPAVTGVSPGSGPVAGGTTVTISGSGFSGVSKVTFGAANDATSFTVNSDTQITAVTPRYTTAATLNVRVTNPAGISPNGGGGTYHYSWRVPAITGVSPASGPPTGGTTVVITGSGFTAAGQVAFGPAGAATSFTVDSDTQITAVAPAYKAATVNLRVSNPAGSSPVVGSDTFKYEYQVPSVNGLSPAKGPVAGGTSVVITGTGFTGVTKVAFGTRSAAFTVNSPTQITATTPGALKSSSAAVRVTNPAGTSPTTTAGTYRYQYAVPTVTSISPTSGPVAGGTTVTLVGSGFTGVTKVTFGNGKVATFTVNNDTHITATAPAATTAGTVNVRVTNPAGTSPAIAADTYRYTV